MPSQKKKLDFAYIIIHETKSVILIVIHPRRYSLCEGKPPIATALRQLQSLEYYCPTKARSAR